MKTPTRLFTVLATVATACLGASPEAMAETGSVVDGSGDASSQADLTRVRYINAENRVAGRARLTDLTSDGAFSLVAAVPQSDVGYAARVWRKPGGGVGTSLVFYTNTGVERVPCNVQAIWRRDVNRVTVSFLRTCIEDMPNRLYMQASFLLDGERDTAPRVVLNRG